MTTQHPHLSGTHRSALEAIFRHPLAHNLGWDDVTGLIDKIGAVEETPNNHFLFVVSGKSLQMPKPHTKDLTSAEVIDLRHFLDEAGWGKAHSGPSSNPASAAPLVLIVVDHHGTKIFTIDLAAGASGAQEIRPLDPHHFLHHLVHKDQSRERGQRAPEDPAYYEKVSEAVASGGRIIVVGHGTGKSNAAHHLVAYLKAHRSETYARVVAEIEADLSAVTTPQLLELARSSVAA